jgi:hypothetical protein
MAIASLVLGLVPVIPFVGSILAIVFGAVARKQVRESAGRIKGAGMAAWGLALGIISIIGYTIIFVAIIAVGVNGSNNSNSSYEYGYQVGVSAATDQHNVQAQSGQLPSTSPADAQDTCSQGGFGSVADQAQAEAGCIAGYNSVAP